MLKNKSNIYILGIFVGVLILAALVGMGISAYKQKSRLMNIAKEIYINSKRPKEIRQQRQELENDNAGEIKIYVNPAKSINRINPLLYGVNISPQIETKLDNMKFIKNMGFTSVRFPGGESLGYHWKTGKFDYTDRYVNAPLTDINFLIDFCKKTNTKLIVQVNIESGTAKEAAEWVEFMNKKTGFPVEYWELGNEVYGGWDKGHTHDFVQNAYNYAKTIKEYAIEMKKVDPNIKIGADWGQPQHSFFNNVIVKKAGKYIDFLSYHWYPNHTKAAKPINGKIHPTPKEVMANYLQIPQILKNAKDIFAKYAPEKKDKFEFAFLEWDGAWDGPSYDLRPYTAEGVVAWSLANAIFHADCIGQFMQNNVTVSAMFNLQSTMFGIIRGWDESIDPAGQRWDGEIIRPKGLVLKLFSQHFGDTLIESKVENSPYYFKSADRWPDSYAGEVPYISAYASKNAQDNRLFLMVINKHESKDYKIRIYLQSVKPKSDGSLVSLNGNGLIAQNEGKPMNVILKEYKVENLNNEFNYTVPAHSINVIKIDYEK